MSRTFNTYGAISNALKHLQLDLQKEKENGTGEIFKEIKPKGRGRGWWCTPWHIIVTLLKPQRGKKKKQTLKAEKEEGGYEGRRKREEAKYYCKIDLMC